MQDSWSKNSKSEALSALTGLRQDKGKMRL